MESVYSAVRTGDLNGAVCAASLKSNRHTNNTQHCTQQLFQQTYIQIPGDLSYSYWGSVFNGELFVGGGDFEGIMGNVKLFVGYDECEGMSVIEKR
jgi:hypothetical protein